MSSCLEEIAVIEVSWQINVLEQKNNILQIDSLSIVQWAWQFCQFRISYFSLQMGSNSCNWVHWDVVLNYFMSILLKGSKYYIGIVTMSRNIKFLEKIYHSHIFQALQMLSLTITMISQWEFLFFFSCKYSKRCKYLGVN